MCREQLICLCTPVISVRLSTHYSIRTGDLLQLTFEEAALKLRPVNIFMIYSASYMVKIHLCKSSSLHNKFLTKDHTEANEASMRRGTLVNARQRLKEKKLLLLLLKRVRVCILLVPIL